MTLKRAQLDRVLEYRMLKETCNKIDWEYKSIKNQKEKLAKQLQEFENQNDAIVIIDQCLANMKVRSLNMMDHLMDEQLMIKNLKLDYFYFKEFIHALKIMPEMYNYSPTIGALDLHYIDIMTNKIGEAIKEAEMMELFSEVIDNEIVFICKYRSLVKNAKKFKKKITTTLPKHLNSEALPIIIKNLMVPMMTSDEFLEHMFPPYIRELKNWDKKNKKMMKLHSVLA